MANRIAQQTDVESRTQAVEPINACLRSGDYARALDLLRSAAAGFPNDPELSELEKRAQDGVKRKAEADRLITESQELFAQRKSAEAIQLLRKAYELDKTNSLARSILANALVEHAYSGVDTDWLKAESLTNQALALNPAHPTAKTILSLIVRKKETSSIDDWVAQGNKLHSSGDLFAALAWVAEGLAVHPHDPKLLQIQDAIQRDQEARRRQARRGDLDELRRLQREIDGAADVAAKQALAERIQGIAAKHWTDGEILSIANALLLRLGLVQENAGASPRSKAATLILHVPRPSGQKPSPADASPVSPRKAPPSSPAPAAVLPEPIPEVKVPPTPVLPAPAATYDAAPITLEPLQPEPQETTPSPVRQEQVAPSPAPSIPAIPIPSAPAKEIPAAVVAPTQIPPAQISTTQTSSIQTPAVQTPTTSPASSKAAPPTASLRPSIRGKSRSAKPKTKTQYTPTPAAIASVVEPPAVPAKVARPSRTKQPATSNSAILILVATVAAIGLVAAIFFFAQKHPATQTVQTPAAQSPAAAPAAAESAPTAPAVSAASVPAPTTPEPTPPVSAAPAAATVTQVAQPSTEAHNLGTLVIVAGQDGARVSLNGKLQRQITQGGQLRLTNLEPRDYVVQVFKTGFQDTPQQKIRIRNGEQTMLVFNLLPQPSAQPQPQPQLRLASLMIQGGTPGSSVLVDQAPIGTIQPDGTLAVSTINPGDHTVELRRDGYKPRQLKKQFVVGGAVFLAAADAALEAFPGELKITFTPPDARVALAKGSLLTIVHSGVPLNLAAGTYTLTTRTTDGFPRSSNLEVVAGQSKTLDLSLAPGGMSNWEDPAAWKHEKDSFVRKGGNFVLYAGGSAPGTYVFSVTPAKGQTLQWVLNYTDAKNYVLCQIDDDNFTRAVIRNGQKTDEVKIADKADKKRVRTLYIRVSPTEIVHQIKHGESWTPVDRWTQPGTNLSQGKFGFLIPAEDQVALSSFAHYPDLNIH